MLSELNALNASPVPDAASAMPLVNRPRFPANNSVFYPESCAANPRPDNASTVTPTD